MKFLISPSKTMRVFSPIKGETRLLFPHETEVLMKALKTLSIPEIEVSLSCSTKIAEETFLSYQRLNLQEGNRAIDSFDGVQFQALSYQTLPCEAQEYLNAHLMMFSGLYGLLKPDSLILPYRLDFENKLDVYGCSLSIFSYWKDTIVSYLTIEDELLINLASKEYAKVLDRCKNVVTIDFKKQKGEKLTSAGINIKRLRGLFLREAVMKNVTRKEELIHISVEGFTFDERLSTDSTYLFIRR